MPEWLNPTVSTQIVIALLTLSILGSCVVWLLFQDAEIRANTARGVRQLISRLTSYRVRLRVRSSAGANTTARRDPLLHTSQLRRVK